MQIIRNRLYTVLPSSANRYACELITFSAHLSFVKLCVVMQNYVKLNKVQFSDRRLQVSFYYRGTVLPK